MKYGGEFNTKINELQEKISKIHDTHLGETAQKFFENAEESALELVSMREVLRRIDVKITSWKKFELPSNFKDAVVNKFFEKQTKDVTTAVEALKEYRTAPESEKGKKKQKLLKALEIKTENKNKDKLKDEINEIGTDMGLDIDLYD